MNDRFKFRAWFKPEYREPIMLYDVEQTYDFMRGEPENVPEDCFGDVLTNDDYIVMQCTGLKDKNEILIYEGDIIEYLDYICEVIFKQGAFILEVKKGKKDGFFHFYDMYFDFLKVIGNIYENKDLLQEEV